MVPTTPGGEQLESLDEVVADLQRLREQAGPVPYAEIGRRVAELRLARGVHPAAAEPPRSTVYNAFRAGRARLDTELIRDIVVALGADQSEAERWVLRCRRAQKAAQKAVPHAQETRSLPGGDAGAPTLALGTGPRRRLAAGIVAGILLACVGLNVAGHALGSSLGLPLYLDMVGTAVAATALGPWFGALVAVATNLTGALSSEYDPSFMVVGVAGALVWGFGVRRFRMGATFARFLTLGILVACVCSLVATPLLVLKHGGSFGAGQAGVTGSLLSAGLPLVLAVFTANIITSLIDKLLTSYIALALLPMLHRRCGVPMEHIPLVRQLNSPSAAHSRAQPPATGEHTLPAPRNGA